MPFIANTDLEQKQMLADIGLRAEDLFGEIPKQLFCKDMKLPEGLSEQEVRNLLAGIACKNYINLTLFLGG